MQWPSPCSKPGARTASVPATQPRQTSDTSAVPCATRACPQHGLACLHPPVLRRISSTVVCPLSRLWRKDSMKQRTYWLLPDLASARRTMTDLLAAGVETRHVHFAARDGLDL